MKALKITGIIILVLAAIFFTFGFLSKEVSYEAEVSVGQPLETTFEKFNDLSTLNKWIPDVISVKAIHETENKIGSKYLMVIRNDDEEMEMTEVVTDYIPNQKVGLEFDAGMMKKTNQFAFIPNGDSTLIKAKYVAKGTNIFARSLFYFFQSYFKDIDQTYLNNFKAYAEEK